LTSPNSAAPNKVSPDADATNTDALKIVATIKAATNTIALGRARDEHNRASSVWVAVFAAAAGASIAMMTVRPQAANVMTRAYGACVVFASILLATAGYRFGPTVLKFLGRQDVVRRVRRFLPSLNADPDESGDVFARLVLSVALLAMGLSVAISPLLRILEATILRFLAERFFWIDELWPIACLAVRVPAIALVCLPMGLAARRLTAGQPAATSQFAGSNIRALWIIVGVAAVGCTLTALAIHASVVRASTLSIVSVPLFVLSMIHAIGPTRHPIAPRLSSS
jgi:hypothetical protein